MKVVKIGLALYSIIFVGFMWIGAWQQLMGNYDVTIKADTIIVRIFGFIPVFVALVLYLIKK